MASGAAEAEAEARGAGAAGAKIPGSVLTALCHSNGSGLDDRELSDRVRHALHYGFDLDSENAAGWSLLHVSARCGSDRVVAHLLASGANVNAVHRRTGRAPLWVAANAGHAHVVVQLLNYGAHINEMDARGITPVHTAAEHGHVEACRALLEAGADIFIRSKAHWTPLLATCIGGSAECARLLLQWGADPNDVRTGGYSGAYIASEFGRCSVARELLLWGADIGVASDQGTSPLHAAAMHGHVELCILLLSHASVSEHGLKWVDAQDEHGWAALHFAASKGHDEVVHALLRFGASLNALTNDFRTALFLAASAGHRETVKTLLLRGAQLGVCHPQALSALHGASVCGHADIVRLLVKSGSDVDAAPTAGPNTGRTPLSFAAAVGAKLIVRFLRQCGASYVADHEGMFPMHFSASNGELRTLRVFLRDDRLDVNAESRNGLTALHLATNYSHKECVEALLAAGADPLHESEDGITPFQLAIECGDIEIACLYLSPEAVHRPSPTHVLKALLSAGRENDDAMVMGLLTVVQMSASEERDPPADCIDVFVGDWTVLQYASFEGDLAAARCFVGMGANVECARSNGTTPLYIAAEQGHAEVVRYLLTQNANTEAMKSGNNGQPLHIACQMQHHKVVKMLIEAGATTNAENADGFTPVHYAARSGDVKLMRRLMSRGGADIMHVGSSGFCPLFLACQAGFVEMVEMLLKKGAHVDQFSRKLRTPLGEAANNGHTDIVELLLQHGANYDHVDENNWSVLQLASQKGHVEVIRLLLAHGARVGVARSDGHTPLTLAVQCGCYEGVRMLVMNGANVNQRVGSTTALMLAADRGSDQIVSFLLHHGALINEVDMDGLSAVQRAAKCGHPNVVGVLLDSKALRKETLVAIAVKYGQVAVLELLHARSLPANEMDREGNTPVHIAVTTGQPHVLAILLQRWKVDVNAYDRANQTPLDLAVTAGSEDCLGLLIGAGAKSDSYPPPLLRAVASGNLNIVRMLLDDAKADARSQSSQGDTLLHIAARNGDAAMVKLLLKYPVPFHDKNGSGKTAAEIASTAEVRQLFRAVRHTFKG